MRREKTNITRQIITPTTEEKKDFERLGGAENMSRVQKEWSLR